MSLLPRALTPATARSVADQIAEGYDRVVKALIAAYRAGNKKVDPERISKINNDAFDYGADYAKIYDLVAANNVANLPHVNDLLEYWATKLSDAHVYAHNAGVDVPLPIEPGSGGDPFFGIKMLGLGVILAIAMAKFGSSK